MMRLVENWRRAPRMLSVQMGLLVTVWGMTSADTQTVLMAFVGVPADKVPALLGLFVIIGRMIDQKSTKTGSV